MLEINRGKPSLYHMIECLTRGKMTKKFKNSGTIFWINGTNGGSNSYGAMHKGINLRGLEKKKKENSA